MTAGSAVAILSNKRIQPEGKHSQRGKQNRHGKNFDDITEPLILPCLEPTLDYLQLCEKNHISSFTISVCLNGACLYFLQGMKPTYLIHNTYCKFTQISIYKCKHLKNMISISKLFKLHIYKTAYSITYIIIRVCL